jgi:glycosyltransferase involved in cell wall biosynthesis
MMNVLMVHNRYRIRGGEDESTDAERDLLRRHGHRVDLFEAHNDDIDDEGTLGVAASTIWSRRAAAAFERKLRGGGYDLVHVQNFFPLLSPAIHYVAKRHDLPVVQSLRNYRLLCVNAMFFRDGRPCEKCATKSVPWPGVRHGCYRKSRTASAAVAAMVATHNVLRTWHRKVDLFLALSEFTRAKFVAAGFPPERIAVKPNFLPDALEPGAGRGGYALYVGRLSPEKGIATMLEAWRLLPADLELRIVGEGALEPLIRSHAGADPRIRLLGVRPHDEVLAMMRDAAVLLFPSEWYETFGRVAIEAYAVGTPVIASDLGAVAEIVEPEVTGLRFRAGDAYDLASKVQDLLRDPRRLARLRQTARATFEARYSTARNLELMITLYLRAIAHHQGAAPRPTIAVQPWSNL